MLKKAHCFHIGRRQTGGYSSPKIPCNQKERSLATNKSAEKRIRQSEKRRVRNKAALSSMKTLVKKFKAAIEAHNPDGAKKFLAKVVPFVDKTASKGIIHKKRASRIVSRLTQKLNVLAAKPAVTEEPKTKAKSKAKAVKAPKAKRSPKKA